MMLESGGIMLCHAKIVLGKKQLEAQWAEPVSLTCRTNQYGSHRRPSIDASYQVSIHMTKQLQRRRLNCEKSTDD